MRNWREDKIAVIILTYNRYLEFQLALYSVLQQENVNIEIFVFDNASRKSVKTIIPPNKNITYIRHKRNIGFANNFRYATSYIKNLGFKYTFLLSDDDMLAYSTAIADLFQLMQTDQEVHLVRGGFATFVGSIKNVTWINTYNKNQVKTLKRQPSLDRAFTFHVGYYSGQLYKNALFKPKISPYNDLVSPFLTPILKILTQKKMLFLPDKITVFTRTEHNQLALKIYNEDVSSTKGIERSFSLVSSKFISQTNYLELINYKIYSHRSKLVKRYFNSCLKSKNPGRLIYIVIFITPSSILRYIKIVGKIITSLLLKKRLKSHTYLNFNPPANLLSS